MIIFVLTAWGRNQLVDYLQLVTADTITYNDAECQHTRKKQQINEKRSRKPTRPNGLIMMSPSGLQS